MTKLATAAAKAKSATHAVSRSGLPKMEAPEAIGEIAARGVADAKDSYEKGKMAAEQTTDLIKNTFATLAKGAADYNLKVLEIVRTNTTTAFDYAHGLLGVNSFPEFVELSTTHARKRVEAMTAQTKELTELAVKLATGSPNH